MTATAETANLGQLEAVTNQVPLSQSQPKPPTNNNNNDRPNLPIKQQTRANQARWAAEHASEEDLRSHFESIPLEKAFALYDKMRKNIETAGRILNDRSNKPDIQRCQTCGITHEKFLATSRKSDWFLNRPHYREGDRNVIEVSHFCSAACVSLENNKTQGVYGISDRGMLPHDNPRFHPGASAAPRNEKRN